MTNRKNRNYTVQNLSTNNNANVERTAGEHLHHSHHHSGFSGFMKTVGNTLHKVEKPVASVADKAIGAVKSVDNKFLGTLDGMTLPIIIVGGIVVYFVLTKK